MLKAAGVVLAAAALLAAGSGAAHAIGADRVEGSVRVEPATIAAGGTIVVAGSDPEPARDRAIVLVGQDLTVELGSVRTDAAGVFRGEFAIPSHLPSGSYELRAIGDQTLAAPLTVIASPANAGAGQPADAASMAAVTLILLTAAAIVLAAAGIVAWRSERVERQLRVRSS